VAFLFGEILKRLLVIDNYDSFTYNLVQMFMCYDLTIDVYRSDFLSIEDIKILKPDYILISPGPKDPANAGISTQLVKEFYREIPILGVCLGMQCINEAFGGKTIRAPVPMHGKTSRIHHNGNFIFKDIPFQFNAARYHSLIVSIYKSSLKVTSKSEDGVIMGLSHPDHPLHGVQFHPESFLTEHGSRLIDNFLKLGPLK
jgi:anthranilate synthase component 2